MTSVRRTQANHCEKSTVFHAVNHNPIDRSLSNQPRNHPLDIIPINKTPEPFSNRIMQMSFLFGHFYLVLRKRNSLSFSSCCLVGSLSAQSTKMYPTPSKNLETQERPTRGKTHCGRRRRYGFKPEQLVECHLHHVRIATASLNRENGPSCIYIIGLCESRQSGRGKKGTH